MTEALWRAFSDGYYEGLEISALKQVVRPDDVVLKLGAGVGFISTFMLRSLKAASVHAIEADPDLIPIIKRTHALNGISATVLHGVAGQRDGPVTFHKNTAFWASSVVLLPDSRPVTLPGVNVARLLRQIRPDVVVVDIEGGERDLFDGLDLTGVRSLVVEVHQPQIGGAGIAQCFAALMASGFAYDPDGSLGSNVVFTRHGQRHVAKASLPAKLYGWLTAAAARAPASQKS